MGYLRKSFSLDAGKTEEISGIILTATQVINTNPGTTSSFDITLMGFEINPTTGALTPVATCTQSGMTPFYTCPTDLMAILKIVVTNTGASTDIFDIDADVGIIGGA